MEQVLKVIVRDYMFYLNEKSYSAIFMLSKNMNDLIRKIFIFNFTRIDYFAFNSMRIYGREVLCHVKDSHVLRRIVKLFGYKEMSKLCEFPHQYVTPISNAVKTGDKKLVRMLLKRGANPNCYSDIMVTGFSNAIRNGDVNIVTELINFGADLSGDKCELLEDALVRSNIRKNRVKLLVDRGLKLSDINLKNHGQNMYSTFHPLIFKYMVDNGLKIHEVENEIVDYYSESFEHAFLFEDLIVFRIMCETLLGYFPNNEILLGCVEPICEGIKEDQGFYEFNLKAFFEGVEN